MTGFKTNFNINFLEEMHLSAPYIVATVSLTQVKASAGAVHRWPLPRHAIPRY